MISFVCLSAVSIAIACSLMLIACSGWLCECLLVIIDAYRFFSWVANVSPGTLGVD